MAKDKEVVKEKIVWKNKTINSGHGYGLGFIGAAIYFLQHSNTFWMGVVGILKALVWPAFLVWGLLNFLKI